MLSVLGQMAALIGFGIAWRLFRPMGLDADHTRQAITGLVFILLLPALVLLVIWRTDLGVSSLWIAGIAAICVLFAVGLSKMIYRLWGVPRAVVGTLVLAASWPNATYLGLPVLEETLGEWARGVAIQYDYFACTPLLLSLGIMLARSHGEGGEGENPLLELLKVPALWAAVAAVGLNLGGVEIHPWLEGLLERLAPVISPLMLIALGMGLRWDTLRPNQVVLLLPVLVIQLLLVPALALGLGFFGPLSPDLLVAVTLEAAMPTMVLGVVLCDRYKLDSPLYASAVTLSTLVSLATLPLWLQWLT